MHKIFDLTIIEYNCNDNLRHLFVFFLPASWSLRVVPSITRIWARQQVKFHIRFSCSRAFFVHTRLSDVENEMNSINRTVDKLLTGVYCSLVEINDWARFHFEMKTCSRVDVDLTHFTVVRVLIFRVLLKPVSPVIDHHDYSEKEKNYTINFARCINSMSIMVSTKHALTQARVASEA